jgi:hypothetical protein
MLEIDRKNLVPGKEYYLQCFESTHMPPRKPYKMIAKFEKLLQINMYPLYYAACFSNFRKIQHKNDKNYGYNVKLNSQWRFYEIAQDKVQKNMENRAYNRVLLDLIGDEYFTPVEFI